jgi:hypothetical protein
MTQNLRLSFQRIYNNDIIYSLSNGETDVVEQWIKEYNIDVHVDGELLHIAMASTKNNQEQNIPMTQILMEKYGANVIGINLSFIGYNKQYKNL